MIELLTTKLFIPRPRKNLVSRPRLVDRLNAGMDRKLALIAAPAGFGKTTLLSEWIPQSPRCVTWLSLDENDNDPVRFWIYFIASLRGLSHNLGTSALTLLQSPQTPPIPSVLTTLINEVSAFPDAFVTVLDDYHVIESGAIHEALTFLIDHLPLKMHLVITTRIDPPLPLARLRARDQLNELRANQLRFTSQETTAFLTQVMMLNVSAEEIAALETRTEGWIAGLQIAGLSMQGHGDLQGFIQSFSGSHRHILGYLAEEVLNEQPKPILDFLLQTSILDRLCGPLCDAVTGDSGAQALLEDLEHANLFLIPLDEEAKWYRYHHLFAEVLRAKLQQSQSDRIPELHRRAQEWLEQHGYMHEAVSHALAGREFERAARLIEDYGLPLMFSGQIHTVLGWMYALPDAVLQQHPRLCIDYATGLMLTNQVEAAEMRLHDAENCLQPETPDDLARAVWGNVAVVRGYIRMLVGDLAQASSLIQRALELLPDITTSVEAGILSARARSTAAVFVSTTAYMLTGDVSAASERRAIDATTPARAMGVVTAMLGAYMSLAVLQMLQGRLRAAAATYAEVEQFLPPQDARHSVVGSPLYYFCKGNLLYEWNDLDASEDCLARGMELVRGGMATDANVVVLGYLTLARLQHARGLAEEAMATLDAFVQLGLRRQFFETLIEQAAATQAQIQLRQGDLPAALQWAEVSGLSPADQIGFPREVAHLILARLRIATGQAAAMLPLLDRLLTDAEAKARMHSVIGILTIQALAYDALADHPHARIALERALTLGAPEGYIRIFVDEGEPMRLLLLDYQSIIKKKISNSIDSQSLHLLTYIDKLLASFSQPAPAEKPRHETLLEPLSERELDILRLIAMGRSNQEIAEILVLAVSTVKSHINNLYGKLGTNRRTEAIAIARDLGLLSE